MKTWQIQYRQRLKNSQNSALSSQISLRIIAHVHTTTILAAGSSGRLTQVASPAFPVSQQASSVSASQASSSAQPVSQPASKPSPARNHGRKDCASQPASQPASQKASQAANQTGQASPASNPAGGSRQHCMPNADFKRMQFSAA